MKGILKRIKGALLIASTALPALVLAGSIAGGLGAVAVGEEMESKTYDALSQDERVVQIVEENIDLNDKLLEENAISLKEHNENVEYLKSQDFLDSLLESDGILKEEYQGKLEKAQRLQGDSAYSVIPLVFSTLASFFMYCPSKGFTFAGEFINEGREMIKDAKEEAKIKKKEREIQEEEDSYTENVVD